MYAGDLVAEHERERAGIVTVDDVKVGMADTAGGDLDHRPAGAVGLGIVVADDKGGAGVRKDHGADGQWLPAADPR
jgi:hypothetical protein